MTTAKSLGATLSDADLIAKLKRLVANEREATTELLRSLIEFDARRLYFGEGYASLFVYCTEVLHYAEHAALNRIEVARAARRFPMLLEHIADGRLHLAGARLLAPHLTGENSEALLAAARHKTKREIEELIAALNPRPDAASFVRKLQSPESLSIAESAAPCPEPSTTATALCLNPVILKSTPPPSVVMPLAAERFKVQFTISRDTRDKLRQVQDMLRHVVPNGDPAIIFDRALTVLLADLERKKFAAASTPRRGRQQDEATRHVPAAVRRAVWRRDGVSAISWVHTADARNVGSSSSTTSYRSRSAARRRSKTSNCVAVRTTPMKRRCFLRRKTRVFSGW